MPFKKLLASTLVALQLSAVQVIAQLCQAYCSNYAQFLDNCRDLYSSGVDGSGAITTQAVDCMCVGNGSVTGVYVIAHCYSCNALTGDDQIVNEAWVVTCATPKMSGDQAAATCWNQEPLNG